MGCLRPAWFIAVTFLSKGVLLYSELPIQGASNFILRQKSQPIKPPHLFCALPPQPPSRGAVLSPGPAAPAPGSSLRAGFCGRPAAPTGPPAAHYLRRARAEGHGGAVPPAARSREAEGSGRRCCGRLSVTAAAAPGGGRGAAGRRRCGDEARSGAR